MLTFPLNITSVQESNIFLRKLWSEFNDIRPMGWEMFPYKCENRVIIGISTLGEVSYDYKKRGCIKNLYIDNDKDKKLISEAVYKAEKGSMVTYAVSFELKSDEKTSITEISLDNCTIFTHNDKIYLRLNFEAYSLWDLKTFLPNKYDLIISILYEYTHTLFEIVNITVAEKILKIRNVEPPEYNYNWIDTDECPREKMVLL